MSGQQRTAVLQSGAAFQGGFGKIAQLSRDIAGHRQHGRPPEGHLVRQRPLEIEQTEKCGRSHGCDRALPGLSGADARRELPATEGASDVQGGSVAGPVQGDGEEQQRRLDRPQRGGASPGPEDVEHCKDKRAGGGQRLAQIHTAHSVSQRRQRDKDGKRDVNRSEEKREAGESAGDAGPQDAVSGYDAVEFPVGNQGHQSKRGREDRIRRPQHDVKKNRDQDCRCDEAFHGQRRAALKALDRPSLAAFRREAALPRRVRGPALRAALARLARMWAAVDIVLPPSLWHARPKSPASRRMADGL